jgi:EmrB/QacA subfamily drug resistance transporter
MTEQVKGQIEDAGEVAGADRTGHPWRWWILAVILAAEILDLLDATVVTVAAPSIREDLGGSASTMQWVTAAYTLAFGVLLVLGGRLGDRFGRRRLFVIGASGFTLFSLACAIAVTPGQLIAFRALEGAFGALLLPQGMGIIKSVFPASETGRAFSLFGPVIGLSAVGGPILAGALIELDLAGTHWRMIFLINLPLGIAAVAGALRWIPRDRPRPGVVIDLVSAALLGTALLAIIHALIQGPERDWPVRTWLEMGIGAVLLAVFAGWERRSRQPLIAPALLRNRGFTSGLLVLAGFFAGMTGLMLTLSLFTQGYLGYSAFRAGLTLAPMALGVAISAVLTAGLIASRPRQLLAAGVVVEVLAVLTLAAVIRGAGPDLAFLALLGPLLAIGLGMGAVIGPLFDLAIADVPEVEAGGASGVLTAIQQLSGAVGVAGITTVYLARIQTGPVPVAMALSLGVVAALLVVAGLLIRLLPARTAASQN